jgi:hypothetical protein
MRDTSLASLDSQSRIGPGAGPAPSVSQAAAFAHAVNLRGYLVPEMVEAAREGRTNGRGDWKAFVACTGAPRSPQAVIAIHSPVFTHRRRLDYELVYSTVAVLGSEADARRFITIIASARARTCIEHDYRIWLYRLARRGSRLHFAHLALTRLPASVPATYRGLRAYDATAMRITAQARFTTRRGRRARFPIYAQGFAFAYGRAVIGLSAFTALRPYPDANQHFLEAALVGRAEAHAG